VAVTEEASCGLAITVAAAKDKPIQESTMTMQFPLTRRTFTRQLLVSPALAGAPGLAGPLCSIARAQSTLISINVTSKSPQPQNFFFFQQPAIYTGGLTVYSNSLFNGSLPPFNPNTGSQISFLNTLQYYAGVQNSNTSAPPVGQTSGYNTAWAAIALQSNPPSGTNACSANFTQMNGTQLALSAPVANPAVQPGAFRIVMPTWTPGQYSFNAGSATQNMTTGNVVLSNFVLANPTTNLDCQPVLKYYVQTGTFTPGTVMSFTASSIGAGLCDATNGKYNFNVVYGADGQFTVT
jgi:hypothetical protein